MTNKFQEITTSLSSLAGLLRALPILETPWDAEFQKRFCAACKAENCDDCPNESFRNNPEWWLSLEACEGAKA